MSEAVVALIIAGASALVAGFAGWIRWSIRTAVKAVANDQIAEIKQSVDQIVAWTKAHDQRHSSEQEQLIAALDRQGLAPPDGWARPQRVAQG